MTLAESEEALPADHPHRPSVGDEVPAPRPRRRFEGLRYAFYLLRRSPSSMLGAFIVGLFVVAALFGRWIVPYPDDLGGAVDMANRLQPPSAAHWFGTDDVGNDIFSRVVYGSGISLQIGLLVTSIAAIIGAPLGILAGYAGGATRRVIMWVTNLFLSVPGLVLAIALVAVIGPGIFNAIVALALVWWPGYVRLLDAKTQALKEETFVEAARSLGAGTPRIVFRYLLPNCVSPLIVKASMDMGTAILAAASLGFLGLGAKPPTPEWGAMLSVARAYLPQWWWYAFFPGMAIYLSVLGFNLLGDGLRDILDPRSQSK
ncbi:ABC transporter permease [Acuticoccus kandeliae]|uniref:ABC transporter permease n=1 Tax=Acuticoccus kandeliae TaxID=2073160 RepID=UPI000D3E8233|nr:ABC transporter permease [Acuticoccus kandeliae]